jgi:hypothetical protein
VWLWLVGVDVMGWFFGWLGGFEKILMFVSFISSCHT